MYLNSGEKIPTTKTTTMENMDVDNGFVICNDLFCDQEELNMNIAKHFSQHHTRGKPPQVLNGNFKDIPTPKDVTRTTYSSQDKSEVTLSNALKLNSKETSKVTTPSRKRTSIVRNNIKGTPKKFKGTINANNALDKYIKRLPRIKIPDKDPLKTENTLMAVETEIITEKEAGDHVENKTREQAENRTANQMESETSQQIESNVTIKTLKNEQFSEIDIENDTWANNDVKKERPGNEINIEIKVKIEVETETIKTENQTIKTEYGMIKTENETIKTENETIETENETIETENEMIETENKTIETENETIKSENKMIKTENKMLKTENKSKKPKQNSAAKQFECCPVCNKYVINKLDHKSTHMKNGRFFCSYCPKTYKRQDTLVIHLEIHTDGPKTCDICRKQFNKGRALLDHLKIHTGERPFKCTKCDKSFTMKAYLRAHVAVHDATKNYNCTECNKTFTQQIALQGHVKIHSEVKAFGCSKCDKKFKRAEYLRSHMVTHSNVKPFPCDLCGSSFTQMSSLQTHIKGVHRQINGYSCSKCNLRFDKCSDFRKHINRKDGCNRKGIERLIKTDALDLQGL